MIDGSNLTGAEICLVVTRLPLNLAEKVIKSQGYNIRISSVDGKPKSVTSDSRKDRITLKVMANVVIDATND